MKRNILCGLVLVLTACEKKIVNTSTTPPNIFAAETYFQDSIYNRGTQVSYRASQPKSPSWSQAESGIYRGMEAVYVPIQYTSEMMIKASFTGSSYFHLGYLTQLVVYIDSASRYRARVLTYFPDSTYFKNPLARFTGIEFVEDWNGNSIEKLLYEDNGDVKSYVPSTKQVDVMDIEYTCYSISGYNYSEDDPDDGYSWSEDGGCDVSYIGGGGGGGGGVGGSSSGGGGAEGGGSAILKPSSVAFTVAPPTSIIPSVAQYFDCFTEVGGSDHSYTVTICVNQPDPGTRTAWTLEPSTTASSIYGTPVDVGHSFLILSEGSGSTTTTRNIGFYPTELVSPLSPSSPGQFGNDGSHPYNISGTMQVTSEQFFQILNYITSQNIPNITYNLNSNNCTTFVLNSMAAAGIYLPRTIGTWPGGAGNDPGDLGQDIASGTIPNLTVSRTPQSNHANAGACN